MTFLKDWFNKLTTSKEKTSSIQSFTKDILKVSPSTGESPSSPEISDALAVPPSSTLLQNAESVLNAFEHQETEFLERDRVLKNLQALKELVDKPKDEAMELRFLEIKRRLGPPEQYETVRQERWQPKIYCPDCQSHNLKRLPQVSGESSYKHRYRCLNCGLVFNDDTGTPFERNIPPLNVWMQCWYLMGCTESLSYIASKLGLDLGMIEYMAEQLRLIFKAQKPLTRLQNFEEWNNQSKHLRDQLKEDLLKQYERLSADVSTVPKDTAEFRRQQNLRRNLISTTAPPTGGKKR